MRSMSEGLLLPRRYSESATTSLQFVPSRQDHCHHWGQHIRCLLSCHLPCWSVWSHLCSQPSWQLLHWWQQDCAKPIVLLVPCWYYHQDHWLYIPVCLQRSHLHPRHRWQHLHCLHSWYIQCGWFCCNPQACQLHSLPSWEDHVLNRRHISGPVHDQHLQRWQGMERRPLRKLLHFYLQCGRQRIQPVGSMPGLPDRQDNTQHWSH